MNETCANGCIPSSPRVGCPVHGPKAKPPEPEDLPHPGTGRLLSASPVKPPEPAPNIGEQLDRMEQENLRLRAQLAAAQSENARQRAAWEAACDAAIKAKEEAERFHIQWDRARVSAVLAAVGGTVEGLPTSSVNYLQRLRALVETEATAEALRAVLEGLHMAGLQLLCNLPAGEYSGLGDMRFNLREAKEALAAHSKAVGP